VLTEEERDELTKLARSRLSSVRLALRAKIVLLAADGMQNKEIAEQLKIGRIQVSRWREATSSRGLRALSMILRAARPRRRWMLRDWSN
jgi:transposase